MSDTLDKFNPITNSYISVQNNSPSFKKIGPSKMSPSKRETHTINNSNLSESKLTHINTNNTISATVRTNNSPNPHRGLN